MRKSTRTPTAEQKQAAAERRERIRQIAKVVAGMTQQERDAMSARVGIVTVEGRALSPFNACLLLQQAETVSMVVGFNPGGNCDGIAPDSIAYWIKKLGGDADPDRLPHCIVCQAEAVESFCCNCDLTHWLCAEHLDIPRRDCAFIEYERRQSPVRNTHAAGTPFKLPDPPTVKRLDIFGQVHDTYQTEAELNGWRPSQGRML